MGSYPFNLLIFSGVLFIFLQRKPANVNVRARNLFWYTAICYCINALICLGILLYFGGAELLQRRDGLWIDWSIAYIYLPF